MQKGILSQFHGGNVCMLAYYIALQRLTRFWLFCNMIYPVLGRSCVIMCYLFLITTKYILCHIYFLKRDIVYITFVNGHW